MVHIVVRRRHKDLSLLIVRLSRSLVKVTRPQLQSMPATITSDRKHQKRYSIVATKVIFGIIKYQIQWHQCVCRGPPFACVFFSTFHVAKMYHTLLAGKETDRNKFHYLFCDRYYIALSYPFDTFQITVTASNERQPSSVLRLWERMLRMNSREINKNQILSVCVTIVY